MLTEQQIRDMEPGRELDKLVATHIMKYSIYHYDKDIEANCYFMLVNDELDPVAPWESYNYRNGERKTEAEAWNDCPKYSTDISAAWEVVGKLGPFTQLTCEQYHGRNKWYCAFSVIDTSKAETAPLAICRAALIAHMRGGEINHD